MYAFLVFGGKCIKGQNRELDRKLTTCILQATLDLHPVDNDLMSDLQLPVHIFTLRTVFSYIIVPILIYNSSYNLPTYVCI